MEIPPVPKNYKDVTDQSAYNIAKAVQRLIPIIEELGDNFEMDVEDYIVTIKRKDEIKKKDEISNG